MKIHVRYPLSIKKIIKIYLKIIEIYANGLHKSSLLHFSHFLFNTGEVNIIYFSDCEKIVILLLNKNISISI
jgi:hypothetical protein